MGQSAPTVTQMMDRFEARYAGFRAGLSRTEQGLFDRLVAEGHHHSPSLNSHPELDFERPLFLAMLLGTIERLEREQGRMRRRVVQLESRFDEAVGPLRRPPSAPAENQARLAPVPGT